jgi:hypothetical protein
MDATVLLIGATDTSVSWSVAAGTGNANIDQTGLLTDTGEVTVTVVYY